MSDSSALTLSDVLKAGESKAERLQEFIRQQEARGLKADKEAFEKIVKTAATSTPQEDQTSRSPAGGGLSGK